MDYTEFLMKKTKRELPTGIEVEVKNKILFEWQKKVVEFALKRGSAALFEDTGLGKGPQQLVWAEEINRYTNKPVLIVAPLAVSAQTKREAEKFRIEVPVKIVRDADQVINGINITNYEILHHFDTSVFSGVVLDESSILKAYMGKTKRMIVDAFKRTPFKLACTATPAPNDLMELLNHAEFLNIMKSSEALSIWFIADQSQSGHYRLKGHAEKDFWDWVATWAICMDKPSDIGYSDEGYILPPLNVKDEIVKTDWFDETGRLRDVQTSATGFYKEKAFTAPLRVERTVEIVAEHPDEQFVIWCDTNDEADRLKKALPDCVEVRGSDKPEKKEQAAIDFVNGKIRVLVSKSEIFGFGLNFQNCHNTIFCGMNYSFEGYYQAVRRFHRFGQPLQVNVWRVMGDTEHNILSTIERKEKMKEHMQKSMSASMKDAQISNLKGLREFKISESKAKYDVPAWLTSVC